MSSATDAITNSASYTAQEQAKNRVTGSASSQLSQSQFLTLLTKQLQYQDPMEPMDNAQFVSQTNQFAQLQALTDISQNQASNNSIMQTLSLVGKDVTITDPDNAQKTITGQVTESRFNSSGAAIVVNGTSYPISLVQSVKEHTAATTSKT